MKSIFYLYLCWEKSSYWIQVIKINEWICFLFFGNI